MCKLVSCYQCGYQDEPTEMMPLDDRTLFGELVNKNTDWYCSDCSTQAAIDQGKDHPLYRREPLPPRVR